MSCAREIPVGQPDLVIYSTVSDDLDESQHDVSLTDAWLVRWQLVTVVMRLLNGGCRMDNSEVSEAIDIVIVSACRIVVRIMSAKQPGPSRVQIDACNATKQVHRQGSGHYCNETSIIGLHLLFVKSRNHAHALLKYGVVPCSRMRLRLSLYTHCTVDALLIETTSICLFHTLQCIVVLLLMPVNSACFFSMLSLSQTTSLLPNAHHYALFNTWHGMTE